MIVRGRSLMRMVEFLEVIWGYAYVCDVIFVNFFLSQPLTRVIIYFYFLPFLFELSNELVCGIHPVSRAWTRLRRTTPSELDSVCVEWLPINEFVPGQRVRVQISHSIVMSLNISMRMMCHRHELDAHVGNSRSHLRWFIFVCWKFW